LAGCVDGSVRTVNNNGDADTNPNFRQLAVANKPTGVVVAPEVFYKGKWYVDDLNIRAAPH